MSVTLTDSYPLYEALQAWRVASQKQRWAYYDRNSIDSASQDFIYDALIQRHEDIVENGFPFWFYSP